MTIMEERGRHKGTNVVDSVFLPATVGTSRGAFIGVGNIS